MKIRRARLIFNWAFLFFTIEQGYVSSAKSMFYYPFQTISQHVVSLVDDFFRGEYGKAVSFLTAKFEAQHLDLAEGSVQETLYKTVKTCYHSGIPQNPDGWMATVDSNKILDQLRRSSQLEREETIINSLQHDVVKKYFRLLSPFLKC